MGGVTDFITSFHNLEGDLIGERKKNLYKLIQKPSLFSNEQELNEAFQTLVPETYQENVFYLDALIYFKRTEKLLEILKGGNQLFATKILKQPWFFEQAFKNIGANLLVNEFLPYLSYVVRKKLLNRISKCWEEKKMDELFNELDKCYGLTEAVEILHKCSPGKITSILEENEIKLKPNQVIQLCTKSDEVLKTYLNHLKKNTKTAYAEQKVINFMALNKPKLLIELEKNEIILVTKVGRRTTKNIMKSTKNEISTDIKRYTNFLNKRALVRKYSPDFKTVYKTVFPDKFNDVNWCTCELIYYYPKKRRWNLFFTTFSEKFPRKSLTDILPSFDDDIKKFEPPKDIIRQWAKIFYEKRQSDYNSYLKYYPTSEAIQIIKEKIHVTSDKFKRLKFVEILLETCAENKDMNLLEEVLKYISERHRNEDANFRNNLLDKIDTLFDLKEMKETHWKYIYEQIQILKVQKEFSFYRLNKFGIKHLEFLFKNKKDFKLILDDYLKDSVDDEFYARYELEDKAIEKEIYSEICKIFPDFIKKDNEKYATNVLSLVSKLITLSLTNKEFCIQLKHYPYLVEQIIKCYRKDSNLVYPEKEIIAKMLIYNEAFPQYAITIDDSTIVETFSYVSREVEKSIWWFNDVFEKVVNKKNRSDLGNKLLKVYLEEVYEKSPECLVMPWLLKNEPNTLVTYLDIILKSSITSNGYSFENKLLKQYSHLGLDKKVGDYYKKQLELINKTENDIISRMFEGLLELLPTAEFIKIVEEKYLPKRDKLDLQDEEMRELYKIQSDLTKILAKVPEPYKMLPTIMKFSRGDFLSVSLPALYSSFYKSPQRILYSYVERLSKQAVSARKHAIFLSCAVLDKEHSIKLLKTTNQSNVSSQKHLFSATLKYFVKNPSQELLDKVIENMSTIDKNDTETLDSLKSVHIPAKYRHTYIEKCWSFFENLESSGINVKEYLEKLLDYMCEDILVSLSKEFVSYVLNRYLPVQGNERLSRVNHFAVEVLKNRKSDRDENFKFVFEIVSTFKKYVRYEFFKSFIDDVRHDDIDKDFIRLFSDNWTKYFTIIQSLQEHIRLKLLLLRLGTPDIEKYAVTVVDYMDQLISELSFLVLSTFKAELVDTLKPLELKDKLHFYRAVLRHKQNSITCVLIIQIVDYVNENDDDEDEEVKKVYKDIKAILQTVNEPIVTAYYKSHLTDSH